MPEGTGYLGTFALDDTNIDTGNGGSVGWSWTVNDAALDYLGEGETLDQYYDVKIDDGHGGAKTETVHITITGAEDAVVITSDPQSGSATETADNAPGENVDDHPASGTITYTDADTSDVHTASFAPDGTGYLGTFSLDDTNIDTGNGGSVDWSWSVNDADLDYLQGGEHLVQSYDVTIDDGHGGAQTVTVAVDIYGTNDVAIITDADSADFNVTEDSDLNAGGTLLVADADHDESAFDSAHTTTGTTGDNGHGTFTFDAATGAWTYCWTTPTLPSIHSTQATRR